MCLILKISEIYNFLVAQGMENDPRGSEAVARDLAKAQKQYNALKAEEQKEFDSEKLTNPYSDTRVLYGDPDTEVKRILAGINMEVGEVLLADRLADKGTKIDLIMSHHPEGKALSALHEVMNIHGDILNKYGVPINVAEGIMISRIKEVKRNLLPANHNRAVDAAKLLGLPIMSAHTVADNQVTSYLQKLMEQNNPDTLEDVIELLKSVPEYAQAVEYNAGPVLVAGTKERRTGKLLVDMTGGTSGSEDAYAKLSQAGVGTLLVMHISEKHLKEAEKNHINIIVAGHIASDSLGMNLLLDDLEKQGVEVVTCSGLIRYKRS